MTILSYRFDNIGQAGDSPQFAYLATNNSLAELTAPGFLNSLVAQNVPVSNTIMMLATYKNIPSSKKTQQALFSVTNNADDWSLTRVTQNIISTTSTWLGGGSATHVFNTPGITSQATGSVSMFSSTNNVYIVSAIPGNNTITVTFNANPGSFTIISYIYSVPFTG